MNERVTLRVSIELLSDTIFGSGFSIPGGEDIAVCQDDKGYPYLKGCTLKGLLRESMENWLVWTGGEASTADELLGAEGWSGTADGRRLQLTALTLEEPNLPAEKCYMTRTFTSLEDGVVKTGSLRMASCVCSGLHFVGELVCAAEDEDLVKNALAGIKWAGTMRSRGFGRVKIRGERIKAAGRKQQPLIETRCIRYRLRTDTPLLITDLSRSSGNSYETRGYVPGTAIRGMVMSHLAHHDPAWFEANRLVLLSDHTRFLDAVPNPTELPALPSIKGFYEDKAETRFENVVIDGNFTPGLKRAKLGTFCALDRDGHKVSYWSGKTGGVTRIQRNVGNEKDTAPFQTRYLSAGQTLEGYILLDDPALAPAIAGAFEDRVWLGADRYEGFGRCTVTYLGAEEQPRWIDAYSAAKEPSGSELYLLALSPLTMLDELGTPCGIDAAQLAKLLGVDTVEIRHCATSMSEFGGYNRTWQCRAPTMRMYDRGSIFHLVCSQAPNKEAVDAIQRSGLGIRRAEGFGQVLFLSQALFEGLRGKTAVTDCTAGESQSGARLRRAKYRWVMEHSGDLKSDGLSSSQLGSIQALCEKAMAKNGDTSELEQFLEKNLTERGAKHGARFNKIDRLIRCVLKASLEETLGETAATDSVEERLRLLCLLFDYSRKGKEEQNG